MRRYVLMLVPLIAIGLGAVLFQPARPAFACTTDPAFNPLRGADAVVYGHFDRVAHDWDRPESAQDPSILTLAVDRTLKGEPFPGFIEVHADIPLPGTKAMCPQFDRATLIGRQAVIVLYRGSDGSWSTNRLTVWFTDESRESVAGDALARLLAGTGNSATYRPLAVLDHPAASCSQPFEVRGSGWPGSTFIDIRIDGQHGVFGRSSPDGSFVIPVPRATLPCPREGVFTVSVQAPAFLDLDAVSFRATIGLNAAPLPPDTGSGTEHSGATTREIILLAGASCVFLAIVVLAALASLAETTTPPPPNRRGRN